MTTLFRSVPSMLFTTFVLTCASPPGFSAEKIYSPKGTTKGLFNEDPNWSGGVQLGNHGATGFCFQKYGVYEGALSLATGLAYGTITFSFDYLAIFNQSFQRVRLAIPESYNNFRGQIQPYAGAGIQLADGFSLRVPVGAQYTMLKDPFIFFGGAAMLYGQFADETGGASAELWYNLGARILL